MRKYDHAGGELAEIEKVAELAMKMGRQYLPDYGAATSRHDFTQHQLLSCLILRAYLRTTYRGLLDTLAGNPPLREHLGMTDKLPHHTTLQKFNARCQDSSSTLKPAAGINQGATVPATT
jgi:hypothetical protein